MTEAKLGRPTKLSEEVIERIVGALANAATYEVAAARAGVNRTTLQRWRSRGRREIERIESGFEPDPDETIYAKLVQNMAWAEAAWEVRDLIIIGEAAKKSWQAAAWRLERRRPERWSQRNRTSFTPIEEERNDLDLSGLSDENLEELDRVLKIIDGGKT